MDMYEFSKATQFSSSTCFGLFDHFQDYFSCNFVDEENCVVFENYYTVCAKKKIWKYEFSILRGKNFAISRVYVEFWLHLNPKQIVYQCEYFDYDANLMINLIFLSCRKLYLFGVSMPLAGINAEYSI